MNVGSGVGWYVGSGVGWYVGIDVGWYVGSGVGWYVGSGQRRGLVRGQRRRLVIEVELFFVAARAAPLAAAFAVGEQLPVVIGAGEGHLAAVQGGFLCCRSRTGRASA